MRIPCLLTLLLFLVGPTSIKAQQTRLYVSSGVTFTTGPGDVVDWWGRAPAFEVAVGRRIRDRFEITAGVWRTSLPISKEKLLVAGGDINISGGDYSVTGFQLGIRLELERGKWFRPYLHAGVGLNLVSVQELVLVAQNPFEVCGEASCDLTFAPAERADETAPGLRLGAGIAYFLTDAIWLYAEPTYHIVFSDERFGLLPLKLGLAWAI
jgi:opacity protein-like surface antigen